MLKCSVIITNFNYKRYVLQAIESILNQTYQNFEIILVDDNSTDASIDTVKKNYSDNRKIKIILNKKNKGQSFSFNAAFKVVEGDIIFFLDSDDKYKSTYLEEALSYYIKKPECEFLFCNHEYFGENTSIKNLRHKHEGDDRDFGISIIRTLYLKEWIGSVTSTISMRRKIAKKIFPIPYTDDWKIRADDCLVYAASLVGARKYFLVKPLIKYRIHDNNNYMGKTFSTDYLYKRELKIQKLFSYYCNQMGYSKRLIELTNLEFKTISNPISKDLIEYLKIINFKSSINFFTGSKQNTIHLLDNPYFEIVRHDITFPYICRGR